MKTIFKAFKQYCLQATTNLNKCQGYEAKYRIIQHPFAKEHDAEYLQIRYIDDKQLIKINLCYSIAYQIPIFYFMIYDENSQPLKAQAIYQDYFKRFYQGKQFDPNNQKEGIYLSQNHMTKEYFYTLHHCEMQMKMDHLVPFYLSLLGLNPPLIIKEQKQ